MAESGPACLFNKRHSNAFSSRCGNLDTAPHRRRRRPVLYLCPGGKWVRRERPVGWDRRSRPKIWPLDQDEAALAAYFLELVSFQLTDFAIVFGTLGSVSMEDHSADTRAFCRRV
jgi:hypothetical protein